MSRVQAEHFYKNHQKRYFYNRLVTFMSSGPLWVHILARENAIEFWRKLMGPTKVFRTIFDEPDTIRGHFGLSDTRNTTHGSDSEETAAAEIKFFFPHFSISQWELDEEPYFRQKKVTFDPKRLIHSSVK